MQLHRRVLFRSCGWRTEVPKMHSGRPWGLRSASTVSWSDGTLQPSSGFALAHIVRFTMFHADRVRSDGSWIHCIA